MVNECIKITVTNIKILFFHTAYQSTKNVVISILENANLCESLL